MLRTRQLACRSERRRRPQGATSGHVGRSCRAAQNGHVHVGGRVTMTSRRVARFIERQDCNTCEDPSAQFEAAWRMPEGESTGEEKAAASAT